MRRYTTLPVVLAFLLFALAAMAQTTSGARHTTTTTTTTMQQTSTVSGTEHTVEGCVVKEASDFFLIPSRGNPIELQPTAGQDLSAHAGHKVKVRGVETAFSSTAASSGTGGVAGTATTTTTTAPGSQSSTHSVTEPAGNNASSSAGAANGTGNDLHRLASKQITVANLDHVADTCPVNWNPNVSGKRGSSKY